MTRIWLAQGKLGIESQGLSLFDRQAYAGEAWVELSPREAEVLAIVMLAPWVSVDGIVAEVWPDPDKEVGWAGTQVSRVCMKLRKKLARLGFRVYGKRGPGKDVYGIRLGVLP